MSVQPPTRKTRVGLAFTLFFLSPLVAEFLLGNLPIRLLPALIVLAPIYGGGALLIREIVRRTGRGWPAIAVLGLVYGIVEEAFTTQSLFNPNYLHLNLHLLAPAYIPALGIGGWWTVFVLNLHTAWSVCASIGLTEALAPESAETPWLGRMGLAVTAFVFAGGVTASTLMGYHQDHFLSSTTQLVSAGVICIVLATAAFRLPHAPSGLYRQVPSPWIAGLMTLACGSGVLLVSRAWGWGAAAAILALDTLAAGAILFWSGSSAWTLRHKLGLAAGAALAYGWHAFIEKPAVGPADAMARVGNVIFVTGAVAIITLAAVRTRRAVVA